MSAKWSVRGFFLLMLWMCFAVVLPSGVAAASDDTVSADVAYAELQAGNIVLVDIRRPQEWRQTGVAQGAMRIDMLHPKGLQGFAQALYASVGQDLNAPIVLICRTGNRTSQLQPILKQAGFTNIRHVPEGMVGSRAGAGWIKRGLPVDPCLNC